MNRRDTLIPEDGFFHAAEYVAAAKGSPGPDEKARGEALRQDLHELKRADNAAEGLLDILRAKLRRNARPDLAGVRLAFEKTAGNPFVVPFERHP